MTDEIQKLKKEVQAKSEMLVASLKLQNQKDDLLRDALEAIELLQAGWYGGEKTVDAIKQHLGVEHE